MHTHTCCKRREQTVKYVRITCLHVFIFNILKNVCVCILWSMILTFIKRHFGCWWENISRDIFIVCLQHPIFFCFCLLGGADHGQHGASSSSASFGGLLESHYSAGNSAHAPRLPAGLRTWTPGEHWLPAAAQLVRADRKGKKHFTCLCNQSDSIPVNSAEFWLQ